MDKPKVVILCGGMGTRLREETEFKPKPMVKIGEIPILCHIMKIYSHYGYNDFILCLGYKGEMIKEYFLNYAWMSNDFSINLKSGNRWLMNHHDVEEWNITFADTGQETMTGGRIKMIKKYIHEDYFFATYGDGVSDVDLNKLLEFHQQKKKIGTLTGLHPWSKYGTVKVTADNVVTSFTEKPLLKDMINGGFFVFQRQIFDYIDKDCMLEKEPFERLAKERQLALYQHEGFWHCMDTYKDVQDLNALWMKGDAAWKIWK
jgi:glucose-1-phosphate cytidylyltransferase